MILALRKLIYPPKCIVCTQLLDEKKDHDYVCPKCHHHILREHICPICSKPYSIDGTSCPYCDEVPSSITQIIALYPYSSIYKRSVLRWKYKGIRKYGKGFATLIEEEKEVLKELDIQALIPVPVSAKRYQERGFNQAYDLAYHLSEKLGVPLYDMLVRNKHTKPQSKCTKAERAKNIRNTISVSSIPYDILGKREKINIAIIDDIYTTGSTVRESVRVLSEEKNISIGNVYVIVVCVGI